MKIFFLKLGAFVGHLFFALFVLAMWVICARMLLDFYEAFEPIYTALALGRLEVSAFGFSVVTLASWHVIGSVFLLAFFTHLLISFTRLLIRMRPSPAKTPSPR